MKLLNIRQKKTNYKDFVSSTGFENLLDILNFMKAEKIKFTMKLDSSGDWKINVGKVQPDFIFKQENEEQEEKEDK